MNWKDITRRGDSEPNESSIELGSIRLTVHRLFGIANQWFFTCHDFGVKDRAAKSSTLRNAKVEAAEYMIKITNLAHEEAKCILTKCK